MSIDPQRGEIWRVDLEPTVGDEIAKIRPCVVMSNADVGTLALRIVVPLTDWKDRYTSRAWISRIEPDAINGLSKVSGADAFQICSVSLERFVNHLGQLSDQRVERIFDAIMLCIRE
jgi:mRNA interferase MazF